MCAVADSPIPIPIPVAVACEGGVPAKSVADQVTRVCISDRLRACLSHPRALPRACSRGNCVNCIPDWPRAPSAALLGDRGGAGRGVCGWCCMMVGERAWWCGVLWEDVGAVWGGTGNRRAVASAE